MELQQNGSTFWTKDRKGISDSPSLSRCLSPPAYFFLPAYLYPLIFTRFARYNYLLLGTSLQAFAIIIPF